MGLKPRFRKKQSTPGVVDLDKSRKPKINNVKKDDDTISTKSDSSDLVSPKGNGKVEVRSGEEHDDDVSNVSFFSTLCCHGGSLPGDEENDLQDKGDAPNNPQWQDDDGLLAKLTGSFLYMIGQAPPVTVVRCLGDRSVDQSELSLPQVLTDMAEEFDQSLEQDKVLKEFYETQDKSRRNKMMMKLGSKRSGQRSTSATVSSRASVFAKAKRSPSSRSFVHRNKSKDSKPMFEV